MADEEKLPVVAIVGRQNVGKSSLLNALARRRLSIVDATPGVTRDRVSAFLSLMGRACEVVDTGGVGLAKGDDLKKDIDKQIEYAIGNADVVIFLVDAQSGLMPLDHELAKALRNKMDKLHLVANKADHDRIENQLAEFESLGLGTPIPVSAVHRRNLEGLLEAVVPSLPSVPMPEEGLKIAIVGRRNVGKSTYVNALCGEDRVIVSEIPGTTRDAVDVRMTREDKSYVLIDTAGLRKSRRIEDSVELFSHDRTKKAIKRADVVMMMFDVTEKVSKVDKAIGGLLEERKVPCMVLLNKWDLVPEGFDPETFGEYIGKTLPVLRYAPVAVLSAKDKDKIWGPVGVAEELHAQACTKVPTPLLNDALQYAQNIRAPGSRDGTIPRMFYVAQTGINPPAFSIFVNDPRAFSRDYLRYLENKFREYLPFKEVPLRLRLKRRRGKN